MTKDELLERLKDIEWDDFEVKAAHSEIPKNIWETVSAFANTSGGWIVLGVEEIKKNGKITFSVSGVGNAGKLEQDFIRTLRSQTKFNLLISVKPGKYLIDGNVVLAFYIASSPIKPVYFNNNLGNTFIRTGSGDQRATEMEILAIQRDQAFGSRSEQTISGASISDLNPLSFQTYRRRIQEFHDEFAYNNLNDEEFCRKVGITYDGNLTYGSLLMFGKRDALQNAVHNFWIDYIEIPGTSYNDAYTRYIYRMPEQENIWEYYQVLIQRLRLHVNNPFTTGPDGFAPDDNSQLYALREGLINLLSHADYFSPMHSTIRVFDNRIEFQNAGRFYIGINRIKEQIVSMPRNPSIIKFFRYAKLAENAGYGIDKMLKWQEITGQPVTFSTDIVSSTIIYSRPVDLTGGQKDDPTGGQKDDLTGGQKDDPTGGQKDDPTGGQKDDPTGGQKDDLTGGQKDDDPTGGQKNDLTGGQKNDLTGGQKDDPTGGQKDDPTGGQKDDLTGGQKDDLTGGQKDDDPTGGQKDDLTGGQKDDDPTGGQKNDCDTRKIVFNLIKDNPSISRKELSNRIGIVSSAIQKHIKYFKDNHYILREGSDKKGTWKILKDIND